MKITFINVGYGESLLLECPSESHKRGLFTVLIDGGSKHSEDFLGDTKRTEAHSYLQENAISHIDLLISTHIHEDHVSGLIKITDNCTVTRFLHTFGDNELHTIPMLNDEPLGTQLFISAVNDFGALQQKLKKNGTIIQSFYAGHTETLCKDLDVKVLAPQKEIREENIPHYLGLPTLAGDTYVQEIRKLDITENNRSFILSFDYKGTKILLVGDTNCEGYAHIAKENLKADIFKIGHHGQPDGLTAELLEAILPKVAIMCGSSDRRCTCVNASVLEKLAKCSSKPRAFCPDLVYAPPLLANSTARKAISFEILRNGNIATSYIV